MTNLEYMRSLDAEELVAFIYGFFIDHGKMYTHTTLGQAEWLRKEYCGEEKLCKNKIKSELTVLRWHKEHDDY